MNKTILLTHIKKGEIMKVKQFMSKSIITADIDISLPELSKIMKENDIGIIPIKDKNEIIGVITDRDIVIKIIANNDNKIKGYINTNIISVDLNDNIEKALKLMEKNKVKRLLVKNEDGFVGIISLSDIINNADNNLFVNAIKSIWEINKNTDKYEIKIDQFYL